MKQKILSQTNLIYGDVKMPEGWIIDREKLVKDITIQNVFKKDFKFSKEWDELNTYLRDYANLKYGLVLRNKDTWGNIYYPGERSQPYLQIDYNNLKNSPDFVFLYGAKIEKNSCFVRIYYDDNKRKGLWWDIPINDNSYVMFPATQTYFISQNKSSKLNFIQTITYIHELN